MSRQTIDRQSNFDKRARFQFKKSATSRKWTQQLRRPKYDRYL